MGLLRKAAYAATVPSGTPAPAASNAAPRASLLRKVIARMKPAPPAEVPPSDLQRISITTESPPTKPAAEPAADPQKLILDILKALGALHDGVELPSELFSLLIARLGIRKGALLLFDPLRMVYAPWAARGYDPTTMHRMRISLGATESWNALANGAPLLLGDPATIAPYQPYFSSREYSSISRLLLTPFIAEEKLIAVLLASDLAAPFPGDQELLQCLAQVSQACSNRVYAARAARLAGAGIDIARPGASTGDETSRFIAALGSAAPRILLMSLSLEDFTRSIAAVHEHLDPFRLHEDLTYFLGTFLADVGRIMTLGQGRFIVGLSEFDRKNLDLFLHQMMLFLRGLFGGNGSQGVPSAARVLRSALWPADGGELRSLVESLTG
jgi:hypothetical protein